MTLAFAACSLIFNISFLDKVVLHFPSTMPYYWCHKSVNDQTLLSFLTIHLAEDTFLPMSIYYCYTEQRVAICCTLPMSSKSCFMWRLSWGSLARGSGGSNSPVKSSQLSRTRRKRENMLPDIRRTARRQSTRRMELVTETKSSLPSFQAFHPQ